MNNRERFLTAVKKGQPDRVPYFDLGFSTASILNIGKHFSSDLPENKPLIDCTPDHEMKYYEVQIGFTRELDIDALNSRYSADGTRVPNTEDLVRDRYGIIHRISPHGHLWPVDGPIKNPNDLKKFKEMRPDEAEFRKQRYFRENIPERTLVGSVHGPFRFSWSLMGKMEELLFNFVANPDFCLQLARITADFVKEVVEMTIDEGAEVIVMVGDLAFKTNTLMSPDQYRKFVKPFHYEIVEVAHRRGVPIIKHSDGNLWPIIDDLLEIGFDGIHSVEPGSMDIKEVKEYLTGKGCVMGNMDVTNLLPFATEDEVAEAVKDTIRKAAPGGGYILSSANSIHSGCKAENVIAMFQAANEYGRYPIVAD